MTAIAEGECEITATTANGKTAACQITVTKRPPTTYSVTVNAAEHGRVTADRPEAEAESEVTLTVTPDEGYGLNSLVYQYTEELTDRT